ncbi:hypothetical protein Y695_01795 [Hydrogenophaga sp. T4]|nr:hypothetical protein Y695_01795 [Hydrogenophaga sp. T4]
MAGRVVPAAGIVGHIGDEAAPLVPVELNDTSITMRRRPLISSMRRPPPAPLSRIMSDICSSARSQLPACTLVMLPGWPEAASRMKEKHSSPRNSARKMRSGFMRRQASSKDLAVTRAVPWASLL